MSSTSAGDECSDLIEQSKEYLLGVCSSCQLGNRAVRADSPKEDRLELIHAGVCKEQGGIISRHHRAGWNHLMLLAPEEVQEGCSDPLTCTIDSTSFSLCLVIQQQGARRMATDHSLARL